MDFIEGDEFFLNLIKSKTKLFCINLPLKLDIIRHKKFDIFSDFKKYSFKK